MKIILIFTFICTAFIYTRWYSLPTVSQSVEKLTIFDDTKTEYASHIKNIDDIINQNKGSIIYANVPVTTTYTKEWGAKIVSVRDTAWTQLSELKFYDPTCGCTKK